MRKRTRFREDGEYQWDTPDYHHIQCKDSGHSWKNRKAEMAGVGFVPTFSVLKSMQTIDERGDFVSSGVFCAIILSWDYPDEPDQIGPLG